MKPGRFFVLNFDFSIPEGTKDDNEAVQCLLNAINLSFRRFYQTYSMYLGGDVENLILPHNPNISLGRCARRVEDAISKGCGKDGQKLTDIQGVRMNCSLILLG